MEKFDTIVTVSNVQAGRQANWRFLDCRFDLSDPDAGLRSYNAGRIPGAQYAHLDRDLSAPVRKGVTGRHPLPDPEVFLAKVRTWGIRNDDQVVCYDQDKGAFAARAWWMLRWLGHDSVAVLDGGWAAWIASGGEITQKQTKPVKSEFQMKLRDTWSVSSCRLEDLLERDEITLVDARLPERFRGELEPLDPVAGHIRGAMNHPFVENLDADGNWKSAEDLKELFSKNLKNHRKGVAVFYCGSGVTACHNLLAYKRAGYSDAILYPGSWSEWITDHRRLSKIEPQR